MLRFRRVRTVAAVGAFAVALGLVTGPADPVAEAEPRGFTIVGAGYGHGIGMSQYGAHGMALRGLVDRLEGQWLRALAAVDARGAAGAEEGVQAGSTAGWLRRRLRMGPSAASSLVRTARALFRGPLTGTAQALTSGELSAAHASVLAAGTHDLPDHLAADAEPVLLEAALRLDPPRLRRVVAHLRLVADPDGADHQAERRHQQRGLWLASTWEGMVAVNGLLDPEAGQTLLAALEPLARPTGADDDRSGGQRRADALAELARRTLEAGRLPQTGGVRPQLTGDRRPGQPPQPRWAGWGDRWGWGRWTRRRVGGWPVTARSPGCWSPVTPSTRVATVGWRGGCGRRRPGSPRPLVAPPPSRWRSAGPAGSSGRPTRRPGRPRRRLRGGRLRPTPGLVRGPPSAPLAPWRPHRPREPGPGVPGPSPGGARGRLAAGPRPRRPADRHPTVSKTPTPTGRRLTRPEPGHANPPLVGARPCRPADPPAGRAGGLRTGPGPVRGPTGRPSRRR